MEAVAQKWEVQDTEDEEVVLRQQHRPLHINATNYRIEGSAAFSTDEVSIGVDAGIHLQHGENGQNNNLLQDAENKNLLPTLEPPISFGFATSSSSHVTTQSSYTGSAAFYTNEVSIGVDAGIHLQNGENGQNNNLLQNAKNKNLLPAPEPPISFGSATSSPSYVTTQSAAPVGIVIQNKDEEQEFYLKKIFIMPPSHGFYCPNCRVCIEKVLVYKRPEEQIIEPQKPGPRVIGSQENGHPDTDRIRCSACFRFLIRIGRQLIPRWGPGGTGTVVPMPLAPRPGSSKAREILKSIVYGGLIEILASLSVVTSAASADATTLNILALAIANLIGGLFVLVHNLRELKAEEPRANGEDNQIDAPVDRYYELLGNKENFILHAFVAILSFLVFGLVPPVVYGFSSYESDDKDFKLAAVAVASLLCITLLAIAKAYIQSANNYLTYFKMILYYISAGALTSVFTYVVSALVKRLVEQLGWFEPRSKLGLFLSEMSIKKPEWGSY